MNQFEQIVKNCKFKTQTFDIQIIKWNNSFEPVVTGYVIEAYLMLIDINNKQRKINIQGKGEGINITIPVINHLKLLFGESLKVTTSIGVIPGASFQEMWNLKNQYINCEVQIHKAMLQNSEYLNPFKFIVAYGSKSMKQIYDFTFPNGQKKDIISVDEQTIVKHDNLGKISQIGNNQMHQQIGMTKFKQYDLQLEKTEQQQQQNNETLSAEQDSIIIQNEVPNPQQKLKNYTVPQQQQQSNPAQQKSKKKKKIKNKTNKKIDTIILNNLTDSDIVKKEEIIKKINQSINNSQLQLQQLKLQQEQINDQGLQDKIDKKVRKIIKQQNKLIINVNELNILKQKYDLSTKGDNQDNEKILQNINLQYDEPLMSINKQQQFEKEINKNISSCDLQSQLSQVNNKSIDESHQQRMNFTQQINLGKQQIQEEQLKKQNHISQMIQNQQQNADDYQLPSTVHLSRQIK